MKLDIKDKPPEFYVGLAKDFKLGWRKHRNSLRYEDFYSHTALSRIDWQKRGEGSNPKVKWRILENNVRDFNPITGVCRLCTCEKYRIVLEPSLATLNRRTELFAPCRHKAAYLFEDPDPPDWTFIFLVVNCDIFFLCGTVIIFSCNLCTLYVVIWRLAYAMKHCVMTSWSSIKLNSVIAIGCIKGI